MSGRAKGSLVFLIGSNADDEKHIEGIKIVNTVIEKMCSEKEETGDYTVNHSIMPEH